MASKEQEQSSPRAEAKGDNCQHRLSKEDWETYLHSMSLLRTIASLPDKGKLDCTGSVVTVLPNGMYPWIWRMWNRDGRQNTMTQINLLCVDVMVVADKIDKLPERKVHLTALTDAVVNSVYGLLKLAVVYAEDDIAMQSLRHILYDRYNLLLNKIISALNHAHKYEVFLQQEGQRSLCVETLRTLVHRRILQARPANPPPPPPVAKPLEDT